MIFFHFNQIFIPLKTNRLTFDRNRDAFSSILLFYQSTGRYVFKPRYFPPDLFIEELIFFGLERYRKTRAINFATGMKIYYCFVIKNIYFI